MNRLLSLACSVSCTLAASCATPPPPPKMSAEEAFAPAAVAPVDPALARAALGNPKDWAKQYRRDIDCERNAWDLVKHHGHGVAWSYLKACVDKGNFTQLEALIDHWEEDLKTRAEAPAMIAQILASRGGHLGVDLGLIQHRRIPVFDLHSALNQSVAFKGRYLVLVGKIAETKTVKGKIEMVLLEQSLSSEAATVFSPGMRSGSSGSNSGSASASWRSNGALGSGSASGRYQNQGSSESGNVETRITDTFEDTGQEVIARLKQPDPFLTADKNLVFLVRFDGSSVMDTASGSEGEEPTRTALVTLISYHEL